MTEAVTRDEMPLHCKTQDDDWNPDGVTPAGDEDVWDVDADFAEWNGK
jgi:hypothetical protein